MTKPTLRIALTLPDVQQPADWCVRLAEAVVADPGLELVAILESEAGAIGSWGNPFMRWWAAVERRFFTKSFPSDRSAYAKLLHDVPVLAHDEFDAIRELDLDVVLNLAGEVANSQAQLARYGTWFLDLTLREPGFVGLATVGSNDPVSTVALFRKDGASPEAEGIASITLNPKFIAALNEQFMCEKAVTLLLRELRRTHRDGAPQSLPDLKSSVPANISMGHFFSYLVGVAKDGLARIWDKVLTKAQKRPGMYFLKSSRCDLDAFDPAKASTHVASGNNFFADPFLWEHDGELYCFFEDLDYRTDRGHIGVGRFEGDQLTDIQPVLKADYHFSFPYLFEHEGELFMMPEACEKMRIEIWKCVEFPCRWELYTTAFEGICAADSTLNLIDGEWWLFTNISKDPFLEMNSELHIFKVDGPKLDVIEPHALNPVVLDTRTARNGGRILQMDGKLLRPSQDNSHGTYGYGVNLMEIRELSLLNYKETQAHYIRPDFEPGLIGCHHLDIRSGRIVIDVRKRVGGRAKSA